MLDVELYVYIVDYSTHTKDRARAMPFNRKIQLAWIGIHRDCFCRDVGHFFGDYGYGLWIEKVVGHQAARYS